MNKIYNHELHLVPETTSLGRNPFTDRFLARVPVDIATTFTAEQLAAVQMAFGMRYAVNHGIDFRRTLSLPWGRFYLVLLSGRDWRREGGHGWFGTAGRRLLDTLACGIGAAGVAALAWRLTQMLVAIAI